MKMQIICVIFIMIVNIPANIEGISLRDKITNTSLNNLESENVDPEIRKNHRRLIVVESDSEQFNNPEVSRDDDTKKTEDHRSKIFKFGKRVLESVNKHGILGKDTSLLKPEVFHIDWWKNDRRLEKIKKRLSDELVRTPELMDHLSTLGWSSTSEKLAHKEKSNPNQATVKNPRTATRNSLKSILMNKKKMFMGFKDLLNVDSTESDEETKIEDPTIFAYMKIKISTQSTIDRDEVPAATQTSDSPINYSLNNHEQQDSGPSGIGVNDVTSQGREMSNSVELPTPTLDSSGQSIDTDRLLQLIPLIVDELRNDFINDEEKSALSWIFGKRLWRLLEHEASKKTNETMDKDLAMFIVKGQLPERDSATTRQRRRRPRKLVTSELLRRKHDENSIIDEYYFVHKQNIDMHVENVGEKYNDEPAELSYLTNLNNDGDEKTVEMHVEELFDLANKYDLRKLEERRRQKEQEKNKERKNTEKCTDVYEDYSFENHNY